jgi:crotonobetainyl-CoA hydratase
MAAVVTEPDTAVVQVRRHRHTMVITINRPAARNSVNAEVSRRIGEAMDEADHDPEVQVVVITGAGDRAFCAGADLKALARGEAVIPEGSRWGFAGYVQHHISKPTIAAVNGVALGGGTEIVLASDLVVAAETAEFGLPEVKRGIIAGAGGPFRLTAQLPPKIAMELLLTGATLDAPTARQLGLVNRLCPAQQVLAEAFTLAESITANAPLAVQASKRVALGMRGDTVPAEQAAWELSQSELQDVKATVDAREGSRAFTERRAPRWQAR